jgi:type IV fimbrial biogenesis protein FimT
MAVMLIIAIAATVTMPLLQEQIAIREIESVARKFIGHAHFARQQALHHGESVVLKPLLDGKWGSGWVISSGCLSKFNKPDCVRKVWLSQGRIDPIFFRSGGRYFIDPHTGKAGILFNAAGAAKTAQGGFVANRLVLGHQRFPGLERQLILGSGGRWRICDPARDAKRCH